MQKVQINKPLNLLLIPLKNDQSVFISNRRQILIFFLEKELQTNIMEVAHIKGMHDLLGLTIKEQPTVPQIQHLDDSAIMCALGDRQKSFRSTQCHARDTLRAFGARDDVLVLCLQVVDDRVVSG